MLASISAPDVLIAYQPVGPKIQRLFQLVKTFPATTFSCTIDSDVVAKKLSAVFAENEKSANVYIDLNTGMNRTGSRGEETFRLIDLITGLPGLTLKGVHAYDGHVKEKESEARQKISDSAFAFVDEVLKYAEEKTDHKLTVVAGGSPSFVTHLHRNIECSPGTFVFWDWGYKLLCPDEPYEFAAIVITRVISIVDEHTITTDLGYKSIASESPMPRMYFLNAPGAKQIMHSEEHLTLSVDDAGKYAPGDVLYAVPVHICPTISLYDEVYVAIENRIDGRWKVSARVRKINI
jgi:D-serine deaminase-like pyridoxal phosphate-dependent protein